MFSARKIASNLATFAGLLTAGDVICQQIEERGHIKHSIIVDESDKSSLLAIDKKRTVVFMLTGVPIGLLGHFWYTYLDRRFPGTNAGIIAKKVVGDQLIFTPLFYLIFYASTGTLGGQPLSSWWNELKSKALVLYATDCLYWPPVQVVNFYFVPSRFRVLYVSVAMLVWNVWLSFSKTNEISFSKIRKLFSSPNDSK